MKLIRSDAFNEWLENLKDISAKIIIADTLFKLDKPSKKIKRLRKGLKEYKIDYGPGYRIYFTEQHGEIFIVLAGGSKGKQDKDIEKAEQLLEEYLNAI